MTKGAALQRFPDATDDALVWGNDGFACVTISMTISTDVHAREPCGCTDDPANAAQSQRMFRLPQTQTVCLHSADTDMTKGAALQRSPDATDDALVWGNDGFACVTIAS